MGRWIGGPDTQRSGDPNQSEFRFGSSRSLNSSLISYCAVLCVWQQGEQRRREKETKALALAWAFPRKRKMLSIRSLTTTKLVLRSCSYYYSSSTASTAAVEAERTIREGPRNDWTRQQIDSIYHSPLLDLLFHGVCLLYFPPLIFTSYLSHMTLNLIYFILGSSSQICS